MTRIEKYEFVAAFLRALEANPRRTVGVMNATERRAVLDVAQDLEAIVRQPQADGFGQVHDNG